MFLLNSMTFINAIIISLFLLIITEIAFYGHYPILGVLGAIVAVGWGIGAICIHEHARSVVRQEEYQAVVRIEKKQKVISVEDQGADSMYNNLQDVYVLLANGHEKFFYFNPQTRGLTPSD